MAKKGILSGFMILSAILVLIPLILGCTKKARGSGPSVYHVARLNDSMTVDANWDKPEWKKIQAIHISNFMGDVPAFKPVVQAKMSYNDKNLYVIFRVEDRYVRCITKEFYGPVWEDSAVEFFFAPDTALPTQYFNLEINCGGTPLMNYNIKPRKESQHVVIGDLMQVEIAHSLPQIIDPEIPDSMTWTLEYRIPLAILNKYAHVSGPQKGIQWRANLYKIAENNSNHHYITWSYIDNKKPDFHRPKDFGVLVFD